MLVALGCSSESNPSGNAGGSGGGTATGGAATGDPGAGGAGTGGEGTGGEGTGGDGTGGAGTGGAGTGGVGGSDGTGGAATPADAAAMVADMGVGANIGNTLENTTEWETGWGQPRITQTFIDGMASHGIKTVRVPVAWDTYAVNGTIDAAKMARVKEVVGWIEAAGMYSIVNIHWDGGWIYNEANADKYKLTDDVKAKFASYWTQIATAFRDVGHTLILEGMNEEGNYWVNGVHDGGTPDYAALNEMNQLFVSTVRAQGGYNASRALLISGFVTDIDRTCVSDFEVPTDPAGTKSLFLSLHYYTPYTFCGLDTVESWGSPRTTWGTDADRAELKSKFDTLGAFSAERGIPVILGELGVTLGTNYPREPASRTLWMRSVVEAALSRGIVPVLWDTGADIQRTDGSFSTAWQAVMDAVDP
ncbi:cellulase [Sorangium cellulosum]|uniref:Cellulase n=1 Tax=Sorangium cellulosum TaxID=56 RepID=A0A4V0NDW2_SORCE|nr:glycoside hydrolase family 5 protein [Sorangium cellulosum]AUX24062.1 cellulase [Sorangium cellulosum]